MSKVETLTEEERYEAANTLWWAAGLIQQNLYHNARDNLDFIKRAFIRFERWIVCQEVAEEEESCPK